MQQLESLTARLAIALETAEAGLSKPAAPDPRIADLEETLRSVEEARETLRKDLDEALGALSEAKAEILDLKAQLEARASEDESVTDQTEALARLDRSVQQVQQANEVLRSNNTLLRDAQLQGVPDSGAITAGLQAEVDGLRAAREADAATAGAILARLEPLLVHAQDLPDGEEE